MSRSFRGKIRFLICMIYIAHVWPGRGRTICTIWRTFPRSDLNNTDMYRITSHKCRLGSEWSMSWSVACLVVVWSISWYVACLVVLWSISWSVACLVAVPGTTIRTQKNPPRNDSPVAVAAGVTYAISSPSHAHVIHRLLHIIIMKEEWH